MERVSLRSSSQPGASRLAHFSHLTIDPPPGRLDGRGLGEGEGDLYIGVSEEGVVLDLVEGRPELRLRLEHASDEVLSAVGDLDVVGEGVDVGYDALVRRLDVLGFVRRLYEEVARRRSDKQQCVNKDIVHLSLCDSLTPTLPTRSVYMMTPMLHMSTWKLWPPLPSMISGAM